MKYPFFASFIILILVIRHAIRRNRRIGEESQVSFWERERKANEVRRKPLDDLIFIKPDLESLPIDVMTDDEEIAECINTARQLSEQKIVNLTGYTNTDLKMKYGVANLPLLMEYDERFTILVQTLQKWADRLWDNGHTEDAVRILEEQVRIHADVAAAYKKLARYYTDNGLSEKIEPLRKTAESLNSPSKTVILRYLDELQSA